MGSEDMRGVNSANGGVKANVPGHRFHILFGAEAHILDARPPRLPSRFSKKRWLLPENRGSGPAKLASIILR
jgi:hypothetical protein